VRQGAACNEPSHCPRLSQSTPALAITPPTHTHSPFHTQFPPPPHTHPPTHTRARTRPPTHAHRHTPKHPHTPTHAHTHTYLQQHPLQRPVDARQPPQLRHRPLPVGAKPPGRRVLREGGPALWDLQLARQTHRLVLCVWGVGVWGGWGGMWGWHGVFGLGGFGWGWGGVGVWGLVWWGGGEGAGVGVRIRECAEA